MCRLSDTGRAGEPVRPAVTLAGMSPSSPPPEPNPDPAPEGGLAQGGLGGPESELLDDGQEEVFSRYEVEHGLIEHHSDAGGSSSVRGVKDA